MTTDIHSNASYIIHLLFIHFRRLHGTVLATVLLAIAGFGVLVTVVIAAVYIKYRKTAIVKASGQVKKSAVSTNHSL